MQFSDNMAKRLSYLASALLMLLCIAGCSGRGRVIPRDKLEKIYYDIIVLDQWVREHPAAQPVVDTTLFFEPIFERYGYTFEDYDRTVNYYVDRPEKFGKVFTAVSARIEARQKYYEALAEKFDKINEANRRFENYKERDYSSVGIRKADSVMRWRTPLPPYSLMLRDSLGIDSVRVDSIAVRDSIANGDSLSGGRKKFRLPAEKMIKETTIQ